MLLLLLNIASTAQHRHALWQNGSASCPATLSGPNERVICLSLSAVSRKSFFFFFSFFFPESHYSICLLGAQSNQRRMNKSPAQIVRLCSSQFLNRVTYGWTSQFHAVKKEINGKKKGSTALQTEAQCQPWLLSFLI